MDERVIAVGGTRILHREVGSGTPLLCLHGFPQTGHAWRAVGERLADRFRVLMPDVPGFGGSDALRIADASEVARLLAGYLDALDVSQAVVLGHDWGGAFALRFSLDRPERVSHLVLTNTAFRELSPLHSWYIGLFNIPVLPELAFRAAGDRVISFFLRNGTAGGHREVFDGEPMSIYQAAYREPERVTSVLAFYRTVTRKAFKKQLSTRFGRGVVRSDVVPGAGPRRIEAPTLIVWGMKDRALPPKLLTGFRRDIPQAEIVELPDVGHYVPEEAPDELAEAIVGFVG